ncbi:hypothetical protein [Propionibacterium sp. oral taxon 192]|uniref:hypothetical protein n=1 Tax=Propionibacterium sp. oral taxon 192 TaxID=671222 RepID=UPI0003A3BA80|nr:hypothetical protein [Propionibacterium sp. oral taxon 192]
MGTFRGVTRIIRENRIAYIVASGSGCLGESEVVGDPAGQTGYVVMALRRFGMRVLVPDR